MAYSKPGRTPNETPHTTEHNGEILFAVNRAYGTVKQKKNSFWGTT